jgi:soluble lytic murein transglycosylase
MIASAYVADRLRDFSGSYVLGLSSYNAGPGRTRQWIREFGDPRSSTIDPVDWIERIPIKETRRYVAKVLSNIQVYRARLGDEATALQINADLNRARSASAPAPRKKSGGRTDTAKSGR